MGPVGREDTVLAFKAGQTPGGWTGGGGVSRPSQRGGLPLDTPLDQARMGRGGAEWSCKALAGTPGAEWTPDAGRFLAAACNGQRSGPSGPVPGVGLGSRDDGL